MHAVWFATSNQNNSSTATDNVFTDNSRLNTTSVSPTINRLSEYDAHVLNSKYTQQ